MSYDREDARIVLPIVSLILTMILGIYRNNSCLELNITVRTGILFVIISLFLEAFFLRCYAIGCHVVVLFDDLYLLLNPMGILILFVSLLRIQGFLPVASIIWLICRYFNKKYDLIPDKYKLLYLYY